MTSLMVRAKEAVERLFGIEYDPKSYWDGAAARYAGDRAGADASALQLAWLDAMRSASTAEDDLVLCAGVGPTQPTEGLRAIGVDISFEMLRLRADRGAGLVTGDVRALPFADGAFRVVGIVGALMHVPARDQTIALRELVRVASRSVVIAERLQPTSRQVNRKIWYPSERALTAALHAAAPGGHVEVVWRSGDQTVIRFDVR